MAKSLQAGKLIIGAIAITVDPTGTAAAALGIDTALQVKEWFKPKSDMAKLAEELDKAFTAEIAKPSRAISMTLFLGSPSLGSR